MANSTAPMLLVTGISFFNQWLGNDDLEISILIGGGIATAALAGVSQVPDLAPLATGIAWIAFITLMFTNLKGKPSPIENLKKLTGF